MNKPIAVAAFLAAFVLPLSLMAQAPSLVIQADHPTAKVSPTLYGLMTEEINYSYDGGIYAELVRDRTLSHAWDALTQWPMVARGNSIVSVSADETTGPSAALARSLKVSVSAAAPGSPAGIENGGYWGFPVRPHTAYTGSFYAKSDTAGIPVTVCLQNDQTGAVAATATVTGLTANWKQFTYTLKTGDVPVSSNNHLILTIAQPATVWFNLISLFPPTYHDAARAIASTLWRNLPPCSLNSCACPAATILRATISPTASTGRRPSARGPAGPRTIAPGSTARPTAWACSSFWSGART